MSEYKVIKKFGKVNRSSAQRFKKTSSKPSRAQTALVDRPSRITDQNDFHLIEADVFFAVKDQQLSFDISMLNTFKYITSVEVRKDLKEKVVTLLLESKPNQSISSWHTVAEDLEANESPEVRGWSESLRKFGNRYEAFMKEFAALKKENDLQKRMFLYKMRQQAASRRLYILSTFPAFEIRYRMKKDEIKCSELCYNETFLKEIGYTLENFTSTVLTEGLPKFLVSGSPIEKDIVKGVWENYMVNEAESPEQETEILMKTGYRKKVLFQTLTLVELSENDLILSYILFLKKKGLPYGSYEKEPYAPEFLEILKETDKQKEYLFQNYYGEKFQGLHSNTEKVCKIKELY